MVHILNRHLLTLSTAMGTLPQGANDKQAARRGAYLAHTRTGLGGLTEAHLLLVRDRHLLPLADLERIEAIRANLATLLTADHAGAVIDLLDMPSIGLADIDAILAARAAHEAAHAPPPAQPAPAAARPIFQLPPPDLSGKPPGPRPGKAAPAPQRQGQAPSKVPGRVPHSPPQAFGGLFRPPPGLAL